MGPRVSILKFINAYLSNQIHLEGEICQGATTFYAVNKKSYPNVVCPAVIVIIGPEKSTF